MWLDTNRNGIQDEEDTGLEGIRVVLEYSPSGDVSDDTQWIQAGETTTNEKGYYRFDELSEGYYRVKFQILEPYTITPVSYTHLFPPTFPSSGRFWITRPR